MELYKKLTTAEKAEQIASNTELLPKDIDSIWEAMADENENVLLSKNYGESITINDKGTGDGSVRVLTHVGENIKFQHIYSLID